MKSIPLKKIFLIFLPVLILVVFASCEFSVSVSGDNEVDDTGESFQGLLKLDKDKKDVDEKEGEEEATSKFLEGVVKGVVTGIVGIVMAIVGTTLLITTIISSIV